MIFTRKNKEQQIINKFEKTIIQQQNKILDEARKSKQQAITALLMLQNIYILDMKDINKEEKSKELNKTDLIQKTHLELVTLLEFYIGKLNEEVGDTE